MHHSSIYKAGTLVAAVLHLCLLPAWGVEKLAESDPYIWLEELRTQKSMDWVQRQNEASKKQLEAATGFEALRKRLLGILDSPEKIPYVAKHGRYYYNFWTDKNNVHGLWRRTTLAEYKKAEPKWEVVLDLDKLSAAEKENWVWHGATILEPDYDRCLISLSAGGSDASVVREFDLNNCQFIKDGFNLPAAKSSVSWIDRDTIYVGTDFGPHSLTASGYPRIVKEWKRGTPIVSAKTIFEGKKEDISVAGYSYIDHGRKYELLHRGLSFYKNELQIRQGDKWLLIDKPEDADASVTFGMLMLRLRSDWPVGDKTYKAGSLLGEDLDDYLAGKRDFTLFFEPGERKSYGMCSSTKNHILIEERENVSSRLYIWTKENGAWKRSAPAAPEHSMLSIWGIDAEENDDYFMTIETLISPTTLYFGTAGTTAREKLKSLPQYFNAEGLKVEQREAVSRDGSKIPYFQVSNANLKLDGTNPTLLYGYGGFEVSLTPSYRALAGSAWVERGGVYVLANIRGGGEFGPTWHEQARKEKRQNAYDDFIAVAEDLTKRKVTSRKHLGIQGGSNGGLLMGVMLTQRPDLFGAVVCGSPLLDMHRYHKLLAGKSWVDEYGDPDISEQWQYIGRYSPYQHIVKEADYPEILFTTSTRDDRVHPGHARKMAARMKEFGHKVQYYENTEGGHSAAANNKEIAYNNALTYTFLWERLK